MPIGYKLNISKEFLEEEYINKKRSQGDIAKELGCSRKSIRYHLTKYGFPVQERSRNQKWNNLSGKKFNKLTVIEESHRGYQGIYYKCKCDCGNEVILLAKSIKQNHTKSCGCALKDAAKRKSTGFGEILGAFYNRIVYRAKQKGRILNISAEYLWNLFLEQDRKCAYTGEILTIPQSDEELKNSNFTASLDRIDSSKGYEIGNVQWVSKKVNQIKMDMSEEDFLETCKNITIHRNLLDDPTYEEISDKLTYLGYNYG